MNFPVIDTNSEFNDVTPRCVCPSHGISQNTPNFSAGITPDAALLGTAEFFYFNHLVPRGENVGGLFDSGATTEPSAVATGSTQDDPAADGSPALNPGAHNQSKTAAGDYSLSDLDALDCFAMGAIESETDIRRLTFTRQRFESEAG